MKIPWLRQRGRQSGQSVARPTEIGDTTMNADASDTQFTHVVTGLGTAQGMTITGKKRLLTRPPVPTDVPLIIALPGGTYTSTYFDIPGYSLLDRAAALGIPIVALDRPGYGGSTPLAPEDSTIAKNADVLDQVIGELWEAWGAGTSRSVPHRSLHWRRHCHADRGESPRMAPARYGGLRVPVAGTVRFSRPVERPTRYPDDRPASGDERPGHVRP